MKQLPVSILGIVPYDAMGTALERAAEEFADIAIDVFTADMEQCESLLRESQQNQYDCILSRGETAQILRRTAKLPVIETKLSILDIKRSMDLASNYTERYAIVAYPSITEMAHCLCRLLKLQIPIHTVHSQEEICQVLASLRAEGIEMLLGGARTYRIAQEMGMNALLITSGTESLQESLRQAVEVGRCFRELRTQNLFLTTFMEGEAKNMTVLDSFGNLYYSSPVTLQPELMGILKEKNPRDSPPLSPALLSYLLRKAVPHYRPENANWGSSVLCIPLQYFLRSRPGRKSRYAHLQQKRMRCHFQSQLFQPHRYLGRASHQA